MFKLFKKKSINIYAPVNGQAVRIEDINDPVFSEKMMGDGFAIRYSNGDVYAPIDGEITAIVPSNHALGISSEEGVELLVHIGLETVNLKGQGFKILKSLGDKVKCGEKIIEIDSEFLKGTGVDLVTPVIITNPDNFTINAKVKSGDLITATRTLLLLCFKN